MRLRPSGKAGPILTTHTRLVEYLEKEAEVWERQAYTRARFVRADRPMDLKHVLNKPLTDSELEKLVEIQQKLAKPIEPGKVDLKYAPGGLIDVEFAAQLSLIQHKAIPTCGSTVAMTEILTTQGWGPSAEKIKANYNRLRQMEQLLTLAGSIKSSEFRVEHETAIRCAQLLKVEPKDLEVELVQLLEENQKLLVKLDPR